MNEPNEEQIEEAYEEAELSDDEFEKEHSFDDLLNLVESNDPSLTNLRVHLPTLHPNNDDHRYKLERLGTAIGRNTQLNALMFDGYKLIGEEQIDEAQVVNLFLGIACNQSIKRLHFNYCGEYLGNACHILTPLFKNNQVERIRIDNCRLKPEGIGLLTTSLAEVDSLKEFALTQARIQHNPQQAAKNLMQSLSGHSRLRKLDLSSTNVGKLGCSALVDLLSNPNINIGVLNLARNNLGDNEAVALSSGMAGNTTLKEIDLAGNGGITQAGWQALFDALSTPSCRLERLSLHGNKINDAAAQSLSNALASNSRTLNTLDMGFIRGITLTGWRSLFHPLHSPTCALEGLNLELNQLNNDAMNSLIDSLANNRSLRSLDLCNNGVTGATWQRFFSTVLANPSSGLEKLELRWCSLNNAAIRALTNALVNNTKLKVINLRNNSQITNTGWEMLSPVLESPGTALEELNMQGNAISDATLTSFMISLVRNKKLKELAFYHSEEWEPPLGVLCNANSIMSTYNSNHILETLGCADDLPEDCESLLQINRENSPSQAARLKTINTHFSGGFITQPFVGMHLNVLPHAMAWMGRDARAGEVDGHYFSFIKSIASLFENAN